MDEPNTRSSRHGHEGETPPASGATRPPVTVCLVNPSLATARTAFNVELILPLGIAYLAGHLDRAGYDVTVVDAVGEGAGRFHPLDDYADGLLHGLSDDQTVARIPPDVDVIGVTCMFSVNWVVNRRVIQAIRRRFPHALLVIGGEHATAMAEYCLRDAPEIDCVVLGEGENTLVDVLTAVATGTDVAAVPGLAVLRDGEYRLSPARPRERELDEIPWPAWDFLPTETYLSSEPAVSMGRARTMSIIASRGCPYACTFCSSPGMWGRLWRARAAADVAAEIEHNVRTYKIRSLDFFDLTMITKRRWIIEFCEEMIARAMDVTWEVHCTRSEAIDAEVTRLLKRAGCTHVTYAAESGSDQVLKTIRKQVDKDAMLRSLSQALAAGLRVKLSYVVGFPDDRLVDILDSYRMAMRGAWRGAQDATFFPFSPYPGSALFHRLVREGRITVNDDYFFGLANYNLQNVKSYCPRFSDRQLRLLCILGMGCFYAVSFASRPKRFWNLVVDYLQPKERCETRLAAVLIYVKNKRGYIKRALSPAK